MPRLQSYINQGGSRYGIDYTNLIAGASRKYGVPYGLLGAQLYTESSFNPRAKSRVGAMGVAQFMPGTWPQWGSGSPWDPVAAIDAQAKFMQYLIGKYGIYDALRAYNAGEGGMRKGRGQSYANNVMRLAGTQKRYDAPGFMFPVSGNNKFSNSWGAPRSGGRTHKGIDIFAKMGTPVVSVASGVVTSAGVGSGGSGLRVWIKTNLGNFFYAHLSAVHVKVGQVITAGQVLGLVGDTGNAKGTSPHLHFGWNNGSGWANPYRFLIGATSLGQPSFDQPPEPKLPKPITDAPNIWEQMFVGGRMKQPSVREMRGYR